MSDKSGYVLRLDSPEDVRQLRLALGIPEPRLLPVFHELAEDWFASAARVYADPSGERRNLTRLTAVLGELNEETLLPREIQAAILGMEDLGPVTKNKVRTTGARVIDHARLNGNWRSGNPFTAVKRLKEPRRAYETLSLEEARKLLRCLREDRVDLFTVALVMGDRKGELFGWRKVDIDLASRTARICRSNGRDTTKTGRPRIVPVPQAALEALRRAISKSPSELVFPRDDGSRMRHDTKLTRALRIAMGAAGIVTGFDGKCRRCGRIEQLEFRESRPCSACGFHLWLVPRTRAVRFQDLRHTAATLHREAGCDPLVIKLLLGHAATDPTDDIYSHLSMDYQRGELDKLTL